VGLQPHEPPAHFSLETKFTAGCPILASPGWASHGGSVELHALKGTGFSPYIQQSPLLFFGTKYAAKPRYPEV
jgi:hypothetical protein